MSTTNSIETYFESSDEEKLKEKQKLLIELEQDMANYELELITLKTELQSFQILYLKVVGRKIATLDELEARILELLAKLFPKQKIYGREAFKAREKAKKSSSEADFAQSQSDESKKFEPPDDLKKLYREVAKKIHPDFASNDSDRERRSELMKEVNQAFVDKNYERLKEILFEENTVQSSNDISDRFALLEVKIIKIQARIATIRIEIGNLKASDLYTLMDKVHSARKEGHDLLQEMANQIDYQIMEKQIAYDELKAEYGSREQS